MACSYDSNTAALREYMAGGGYDPATDPDIVNCQTCGRNLYINSETTKALFGFENGVWGWKYSCLRCYVPEEEAGADAHESRTQG